jgi:O-methyltransferase
MNPHPGAQAGDAERSTKLYLDLLKLCLTDFIYIDDPMSRMVPYRRIRRSDFLHDFVVRPMIAVLQRLGIEAVQPNRQKFFDYRKLSTAQIKQLRTIGADWPPRAHTMIGLKRLDNVQHCVETVLRDQIPGDLIETGVWRGGASIFMKGVLEARGDKKRRVWLADSFRGLPPPDADKYPADKGWNFHESPELAISRAAVEQNFRAYGLLDERVRFLEGWFKDTLPQAPIDRIAVLRMDGDLYESTIQVLDALYAKLSPGGFLIVDDFALPPCRKAIDDFRKVRGISDPIVGIDGIGAYWRKSAQAESASADSAA